MSNSLKHRVLLLLKQTALDKFEKFNKAFELYKETPEKSPSVEVKLNRIGFTDTGLENLLYDLQKLHGITDSEIACAQTPADFKEEEIKIANAELFKLQNAKRKNKTHIKAAQNKVDSLKSELDALNAPEVLEETPASETPESLLDENLDFGAFAQKVVEYTDVPAGASEDYKIVNGEEVKSIRDEFPFLNDKDCPDVLFVVVGRKLSAYRRHAELHAKLQEVLAGQLEISKEDQDKLAADTQEAFAENRALWLELNHYNENKEILGSHPLFREIVAKREVEAMTLDQLSKYRSSSSKFFSTKRKALANPKITEEKQTELLTAIADREFRLGLVNAKLGANGGK